MSWTQLSESSIVLTPSGWKAARDLDSSVLLIGMDRHGRPTSRLVLTEQTTSAQPIFLGTRAAAGWFAPETRIIANGRPASASSLLSEDIRDFGFETYLEIEDASDVGILVWTSLQHAAYHRGRSCLVFPKRDRIATVSSELMQEFIQHGRPYVLLRKDVFLSAILKDWPETLLQIQPVFAYSGTETFSIRYALDDLDILTWTLSALRACNRAYELSFETLQFSAFADLECRDYRPQPVERGTCSFRSAEHERVIRLLWDGASWSPIVGGFVVSPSSLGDI